MTRTYSQIYRADNYSGHNSVIWSVWPNCWVLIYELSGSGFKFSCSHLNFRFRACFEQGVPWHSSNYKVWIHFEMRTWHNKNIQSNGPCRYVLKTQLNHSVVLAIWLSVCLQAKWFWVRVQLQSLKFHILRLLQARNSLTFKQLQSVGSLWNTHVTRQEHKVKWTVQITTQNTAQSFGHFDQVVDCSFTN